MRSLTVLCGPLRFFAVFSHTGHSLLVFCLSESVGRAWGCIMFIVHSLTASFFQCRPLCPTSDGTERATSRLPHRQVITGSVATVTDVVHLSFTVCYLTVCTQALLLLSVMACDSLMRTEANFLCLSENLISACLLA